MTTHEPTFLDRIRSGEIQPDSSGTTEPPFSIPLWVLIACAVGITFFV